MFAKYSVFITCMYLLRDMLRGKIKMNKKLTRLKKIHRKKALKINIQNIKAEQSKFQITLKNKFAPLKENTPTIEELNDISFHSRAK